MDLNITEQIIAMFNYLKLVTCVISDGEVSFTDGKIKTSINHYLNLPYCTEKQLLKMANNRLIILCREKALEKLTNIELANSNLFWCMYEIS